MIAAFSIVDDDTPPVRKPGLTEEDVYDVILPIGIAVTYIVAAITLGLMYRPKKAVPQYSSVIVIERYAFIPTAAVEEILHAT